MLATLAEPPLSGARLVYEPKYDGIRALIHVPPTRGRDRDPGVRVWSRLGNEKTSQFPSVVLALERFAAKLRAPLLLDGEIVALDERGRPSGFQRLQGRIHVTGAQDVARLDRRQPVAFIAFDLLRDGDEDLRGLPLKDRRARLVTRLTPAASDTIRISEQAIADGHALEARARDEGWEGLIVKDAQSAYQSGRRSPAWRKRKMQRQQEFVVGGWTEPRQSRHHFGALLLGVYDSPGHLTYVGHTGTGFDQAELERVWELLESRKIDRSPFATRFKTNEPAHWVRPELVAQVRFTEWTDDHKLRHPVYLGLRDDKPALNVQRERRARRNTNHGDTEDTENMGAEQEKKKASTAKQKRSPRPPRLRGEEFSASSVSSVISALRALEDARRDGTIELPHGLRLGVTNLHKVFWPRAGLTKGDLLRYYTRVAPFILPAVADRPLVMKRFPNGIGAPAFYQQRSRQENPPPGVRIETLPDDLDPIGEPDARRFVGGSLITLLYMTQIAAISQDPWFSRVQTPLDADYVALDLDPGDETPFDRVQDVARWVRDELASLGVPGVPKTSGSSGLHVYIPLPPGTSYESGVLFCQIVATLIAARHPKVATVERKVRARGRGTVYIDYLQNILGKTLATAYSARASESAGVSTPLAWTELDGKIDPRDFTILTAPQRFEKTGDLWARLRTAKPADLAAVFKKYESKRR